MSRWCTKRITSPKLLLRFGDGKHRFFLESVCGVTFEGTEEWCQTCRDLPVQMVNQDVTTYPHGNVNGPYTVNSKIFGSPYYLKNVKVYGDPLAEDLALAMEAQAKAKAGRRIKQIKDLLDDGVEPTQLKHAVAQPAQTEQKKKAPPKKMTITEEPAVAAAGGGGGSAAATCDATTNAEASTTKQKAKQGTRKLKLATPVKLPPSQNVLAVLGAHTEQVITNVPANAVVETSDTPMEVMEVIQVVLRPFTHNNVKYWRDGAREKLYRRTIDGKRGEYIGRWDADAEEIVRDAPDSDAGSDE
jgi:hypothetical protein